VPHMHRRYRTHPSDVRCVESTFASSVGHPQCAQRIGRASFRCKLCLHFTSYTLRATE